MTPETEVLFSGGSGLLGSVFRQKMPSCFYPSSAEFNVTNYEQMKSYWAGKTIRMVIHAAAFTSPPKAEREPGKALETNIVGTANVVRLCMEHHARLIYISTDYVFRGDKGDYCEEDPVYPVNKYAWSKLGGECAVRLYDNSLIIRTTFGASVFPYEKAFVDQWTSRESVSVIGDMMIAFIKTDATGTVHVGGPRKTVFEYAKSLDPARETGQYRLRT